MKRRAQEPEPPGIDQAPLDPCGYIVLIWEHGYWSDNWDGLIHATEAEGMGALRECRSCGYEAVLTEVRPTADGGPAQGRAA